MRKILSVLLTVCILLSTVAVLTIRKIIVGKLAGEQYKTVADLNGDNKVNASDSFILKRIIVGKA